MSSVYLVDATDENGTVTRHEVPFDKARFALRAIAVVRTACALNESNGHYPTVLIECVGVQTTAMYADPYGWMAPLPSPPCAHYSHAYQPLSTGTPFDQLP